MEFAFLKVVYDLSFSLNFIHAHFKSSSFSDFNCEEMSFRFGQHLIKPSVIFLKTELSFALVNRKPVVPGRILFFFSKWKNKKPLNLIDRMDTGLASNVCPKR